MSDLDGLKAKIADDLERGDLTSQIAALIPRVIEHYADRTFHFLEGEGTVDTEAATAYVAVPTGLRVTPPCDVEIAIGANNYDLHKWSWRQYRRHAQINTSSGEPTHYAYRNGRFYLYPTPAAVYTITAWGIYDQAELSAGDSESAWTNEAFELVVAECTMRLARDVLRDDVKMRNAQIAVNQALVDLGGKATRRKRTGRTRAHY